MINIVNTANTYFLTVQKFFLLFFMTKFELITRTSNTINQEIIYSNFFLIYFFEGGKVSDFLFILFL